MPHQSIAGLNIRGYKAPDRESVRKICCDTAFLGEPMERFFDDREILADFVTSYHTDYEPERTLVAEVDNELIGYLTGCKNVKTQRRVFVTKILPRVAVKFFSRRVLFKPKTRKYVLALFRSGLKSEFKRPDFSRDYPASLHINLDRRFRNMGIGAELLRKYLDQLRAERIRGVQLNTISSRSKRFFETMGFEELHRKKVSHFRHLGCDDLFLTVLGKRL